MQISCSRINKLEHLICAHLGAGCSKRKIATPAHLIILSLLADQTASFGANVRHRGRPPEPPVFLFAEFVIALSLPIVHLPVLGLAINHAIHPPPNAWQLPVAKGTCPLPGHPKQQEWQPEILFGKACANFFVRVRMPGRSILSPGLICAIELRD